jgi:hypothetical protein
VHWRLRAYKGAVELCYLCSCSRAGMSRHFTRPRGLNRRRWRSPPDHSSCALRLELGRRGMSAGSQGSVCSAPWLLRSLIKRGNQMDLGQVGRDRAIVATPAYGRPAAASRPRRGPPFREGAGIVCCETPAPTVFVDRIFFRALARGVLGPDIRVLIPREYPGVSPEASLINPW